MNPTILCYPPDYYAKYQVFFYSPFPFFLFVKKMKTMHFTFVKREVNTALFQGPSDA
jgi:hypothetical protein